MNEAEARDLWNRITTQERDEIAYHALVDRYMRDTDAANQEAVRRGTVGAGVLPESATAAAQARQALAESIDRAIARAKEQRDAPETPLSDSSPTTSEASGSRPESGGDVLTDGVTSNLDENQQSGGERSNLQTSADSDR